MVTQRGKNMKMPAPVIAFPWCKLRSPDSSVKTDLKPYTYHANNKATKTPLDSAIKIELLRFKAIYGFNSAPMFATGTLPVQ